MIRDVRDARRCRLVPAAIAAATLVLNLAVSSAHHAAASHGQDPKLAPPVYRTGVDLVEVSVLVRDERGAFVRGLDRSAFEILEEGVRQEIQAFGYVRVERETPSSRAGGIARRVPGQNESLSPRRQVWGEASASPSDVTTNDVAPDARLFVLVLDPDHTAAQNTLAVRAAARRFIERHVDRADLAAVFTPGDAEGVQEFTGNKSRLLRVVDRFVGRKLLPATIERVKDSAAALRDGRDPSDAERAYRAETLCATLEVLARHLSSAPGRKSMLLFSEGVDYNTADVMGLYQRRASEVMKAIERAIMAVARSNTSIYTIDPRGLAAPEVSQPDHNLGETKAIGGLLEQGTQGEVSQSLVTLHQLADRTGGFAAVNTNDFANAFSRIVEESSEYYLLGYVPRSRSQQQARIDVRVNRPNVKVVSRRTRGALPATSPSAGPASLPVTDADSPPAGPRTFGGRVAGTRPVAGPPGPAEAAATVKGLDPELQALLQSAIPRPGLPLRVHAVPFHRDGKRTLVPIVMEIAGPALRFVERGARWEERVDVAIATVDSQGRASNGRSTTLEYKLQREELERASVGGVRWVSEVRLPPGRHQVRVAVRAKNSARSGMLVHEIEVPAARRDEWQLGGVLLASSGGRLAVSRSSVDLRPALEDPPTAARRFAAGDRLTIAAEVYPPAGKQEEAELRASFIASDGTEHGARTSPARGPVPVTLTLDTSTLPPGWYELRVTAGPRSNPPREGGATQRLSIEIAPQGPPYNSSSTTIACVTR